MVHYPLINSLELFASCSRLVRRKFHRAYLKKNGVPRRQYGKVSLNRAFRNSNLETMLEDLKEKRTERLPKLNVIGRAL